MSTQMVGYRIKTKAGLQGEAGLAYNYILAGNGLFIENTAPLLRACICIAPAVVRGLENEVDLVTLPKGKVPQALFDLALNTIMTKNEKEVYLSITWNDGYHLFMPKQAGEPGHVTYDVLPDTVIDIHSHGPIPARFSGIDDADEQGFRISVVIGNMDKTPLVSLRIGVYGNYADLSWNDVFEGTLTGALEKYEEEVTSEIDLSCSNRQYRQDNSSGSWWHRIFGLRWFV